MAYLIDDLTGNRKNIDGCWWITRPLKGPFWSKVKDAWRVLVGKCDAIKFYKQ